MSLISILLLLLAIGVAVWAVWVAWSLGYVKGYGVGWKRKEMDEEIHQWLKSFESKRKEETK